MSDQIITLPNRYKKLIVEHEYVIPGGNYIDSSTNELFIATREEHNNGNQWNDPRWYLDHTVQVDTPYGWITEGRHKMDPKYIFWWIPVVPSGPPPPGIDINENRRMHTFAMLGSILFDCPYTIIHRMEQPGLWEYNVNTTRSARDFSVRPATGICNPEVPDGVLGPNINMPKGSASRLLLPIDNNSPLRDINKITNISVKLRISYNGEPFRSPNVRLEQSSIESWSFGAFVPEVKIFDLTEMMLNDRKTNAFNITVGGGPGSMSDQFGIYLNHNVGLMPLIQVLQIMIQNIYDDSRLQHVKLFDEITGLPLPTYRIDIPDMWWISRLFLYYVRLSLILNVTYQD